MKVNRLFLKLNEKTDFEEEIDFSSLTPDFHHVRRIDTCLVKGSMTEYGSCLILEMTIKADVIASCSYTLEDCPYKVKVSEKFYFTSEKEDATSDEMYYEPGNEINMDDYVLSLILTSVPHNLHKPGAKLESNEAKGYRILTEEEYLKEREEKKSSPFDVLDDLDLD